MSEARWSGRFRRLFVMDGAGHRRALRSQRRVGLMIGVFALAYLALGARLALIGFTPPEDPIHRLGLAEQIGQTRPDILDRNGVLLATDIKAPSLYAEPHRIVDVDETIELLTAVLPDLDARDLRDKLTGQRRFAWLRRELTPAKAKEIHDLGIPGIGFVEESRRIYPNGRLAAHVLGHVNVDNEGIAGLEKHLDGLGLADLHAAGFARDGKPEPVVTTIDTRVQHALRDELGSAMAAFSAKAAAGLVLDVDSAEVVALVSLPDYDPNDPVGALDKDALNRVTTGVYEPGSTFKAVTVAMALDAGAATLQSTYDATRPIRVGSFTIDDYRGKDRVLTLPEVFIYSSNIGTVRMALDVGIEGQQEFLKRLGFLDRLATELPESADPLLPARWGELSSMTISFGHGISVAPLQAAVATSALVNGGYLMPPTFFARDVAAARRIARRVVAAETTEAMRSLMRLNVEKGTGTRADIPGLRVGGKTGTAEKVVDGRYSSDAVMTSFLAAFPMDAPRYLLLVMLDEPKPTDQTHGFRTAGWNAVPTAGAVIRRIAPMLGVEPALAAAPATF